MRRVVKPFAVEVRNSGRKLKSKAANVPAWPQLDDQPDVVWPEIAAAFNHEPAEPTVEPYRDPRKPPPTRTAQVADLPVVTPEPVEAEAPATKPAGRILRVIDEVPVVAKPVYDEPAKPAKRARRPKPVPSVEPVADEPAASSPPMVDTKAIAATLVLRSGKDRLTRDDFKRGQRWKARLPAAVHRDPIRRR